MSRSSKRKDVLTNKKIMIGIEIFVGVLTLLFIGGLAFLNALPFKFFIIIILVLFIIFAFSLYLLCSRNANKIKKIIGMILSVMLAICMIIGNIYLFSTYRTLGKITKSEKMSEDFYVLVLNDSKYKSVDDIEKKDVYTLNDDSNTYSAAKLKLQDKIDISFKTSDDYLTLGHVLVEKGGIKQDLSNIIFLSSTHYDMLCESVKSFKDYTKILYTVTVDVENEATTQRVDVTSQPFNIYVSGIDTYGDISKVSRSDVNMIMTVNPMTKEILLTSIPRDMYVTLHSYGALDKLTHTGIYGVDETVNTAKDWLGIDINYYIRVNFTSVIDIVDAIGGIDVDSVVAFNSTVSNYSYTKGVNHLTGEAALYFARERHAFKDGDNSRIKNQQRVIKGIITKVSSSTSILTSYTKIMSSLGSRMQTDLSSDDLSALVKMQLNDLGGWTINSQSITGKGTYNSTYSMGNRKLYVVIPNDDSVQAATKAIRNVINAE